MGDRSLLDAVGTLLSRGGGRRLDSIMPKGSIIGPALDLKQVASKRMDVFCHRVK